MEAKDKKTKRLKAMVNEEMFQQVDAAAQKANITKADWMRRATVGQLIKEAGNHGYLEFEDAERAKLQQWLNYYIVEEDFAAKHLEAISKIVSRFNWDRPTEQKILEFADELGGN